MSILFSKQCEYALQAVMYIALKPAKEMTSIRELTSELDIPYHFLAKIMQDLSRKGILKSHRGPNGGFALATAPEETSFFRIIEAIDGNAFFENCLLGFEKCSSTNPCAMHDQWKKSRDEITSMLVNKNILEMAHDMKKTEYLLVGKSAKN